MSFLNSTFEMCRVACIHTSNVSTLQGTSKMVEVNCAKACDDNTPTGLGVTADPATPPPTIPVVTESCDGNVDRLANSVVEAIIPAGTVIHTRPCPDVLEFDKNILCELATGAKIVAVTSYSPTGIPSTTLYTLGGAVYAGDPDGLGSCDQDIESDAVPWCNAGSDVTQWINKLNGQPNGEVYWTDAAGAVISAPAAGPDLVRGYCSTTTQESDPIQWCDAGTPLTQWVVKENGEPTGDTFWTDTTTGAVVAAPAISPTLTLGTCAVVCDLIREPYRLDGNATGTSAILATDGTGVVGNTVTIPAGFLSLHTMILRESENDDGDGLTAHVVIDGLQYNLGTSNAGYVTDLPDFNTTSLGENFIAPVTITASGDAFIELWVIRKA